MNISSISNFLPKNSVNYQNMQNKAPSFKGIYVEDIVNLGDVKEGNLPAKFTRRDELLLNEIKQQYPNQDCFIRRGYQNLPRLEYRECPPVQSFTTSFCAPYKFSIEPLDKKYPCVPLILAGNYENLNKFIGVPSFFSLNPSLLYTIKAGFEVHKKLIEKQNQIKEMLGKNDDVSIGEKSITERAHKEIEDIEIGVIRFLMEYAYGILSEKPTAKEILESDFLKVQTTLEHKRNFDLTHSLVDQQITKQKKDDEKQKTDNEEKQKTDNEEKYLETIDICKWVKDNYPDKTENKRRIAELRDYMEENGLALF